LSGLATAVFVFRGVMELMTLWPIVRHALAYGGVLSGISCVLLLGILWINPEVLLKDYPPDIQAKHGPISERSKRQRLLVAVFFGAVVFGVVAASFVQVRADSGGHIPFLTAFVHLSVMFSLFNLVDLLILDWPLVAMRPSFIVLPGTDGLAGYKDYGFHFRGFLIGAVLVLVTSVLLAGVVAVLF
jgi:hypothetical protein